MENDLISRQAAMEICRRMVWNGADDYLPMSAKAIENEIRQLPPIRVCETEPSDLISRQDALNMMWRTLYEYEDKTEKQFQESDELDISDWLINDRLWVQNGHALCVDVIASMPSAQPEIIRCGECKHMTPKGRCLEFADDCFRPSASDFCSRGARREE